MRPFYFPAYTLVELLVALALSLLLLLGVAELFRFVGSTMSDTRSLMNTSARINEAALTLRYDLERIPRSLADKPTRFGDAAVSDNDGYLTIIEGPDACQSNTTRPPRYVNISRRDSDGNPVIDRSAGDVDDMIAFTMRAHPDMPFRGVIAGGIAERNAAEVVWFVRGNTLRRRMRLIDDERANKNYQQVYYNDGNPSIYREGTVMFPRKGRLMATYPVPEPGQFAVVEFDETIDDGRQRYDAVQGADGMVWRDLLTFENLARRARRFGNDGLGANNEHQNPYPHPLYADDNAGWYYLRMPTFEETDFWSANDVRYWKTATRNSLRNPLETVDLWEQPFFFPDLQDPKTGSLNTTVENPRNHRAGEDVVLTNVLSFDVKVWCRDWEQFVDLGTADSTWSAGVDSLAMNLHGQGGYVWDSWTQQYENQPPPPYSNAVEAVQITIRCFDPSSRAVRQVTVVHRF